MKKIPERQAVNPTQQTKTLGIVSNVPMGEWNSTAQYLKLNIVRHKTASFIAKKDNVSIEPFVSTGWQEVWQPLAYDGDTNEGLSATVLVNQTTGTPEATVSKTYDENGNAVFNFQFFNLKGETGKDGTSVNIVSGRYYDPNLTYPPSIPTTDLTPLPDFSTTQEGQAYVVDDNEIKGQVDLYFHGVGGTAWTIIDNWGGIPGQTGRGIRNITFSGAVPAGAYTRSEWNVTYTDDTTGILTALAKNGENGKDGTDGSAGATIASATITKVG